MFMNPTPTPIEPPIVPSPEPRRQDLFRAQIGQKICIFAIGIGLLGIAMNAVLAAYALFFYFFMNAPVQPPANQPTRVTLAVVAAVDHRSAADLNDLAGHIQTMTGVPLSIGQRNSLALAIQTPHLLFPAPGMPVDQLKVMTHASLEPDSGVKLTTPTGDWTFGPNGELTTGDVQNSVALDFRARDLSAHLETPAIFGVLCDGVAGMLLGIPLLVAGAMATHDNPRWTMLATVHAAIKIPVALAAGVIWQYACGNLTIQGMPAMGHQAATIFGVAVALIEIAAPLAILLLLYTPMVRPAQRS
jgi:hypothetical protein